MSASSKSKELKIVTRHVVTLDDVKKSEEKLKLLYVIKCYGEISERALHHLIYELKNAGLDLGYDFTVIGGVPTSKKLREDVIALLYVGLLETNPRNKKLRVTSLGNEVLEQCKVSEDFAKNAESAVESVRSKVMSIDAEVELATMLSRGGRKRRRRF